MSSKRTSRWRGRVAVALTTGAVAGVAALPAAAGAGRGANKSVVAPIGIIHAHASYISSLRAARQIKTPKRPDRLVDRPSIPLKQYFALKAAAAKHGKRPGRAGKPPGRASAPGAAARAAAQSGTGPNTLTDLGNFAASNQGAANDGGPWPPDINGATGYGTNGDGQTVTITNNHYDVYTKTTAGPSLLLEETTNTLFGESDAMTDPRVVFDTHWQRWIAIEQTFDNQSIDLAVSATSDATGAYYQYYIGVPAQSAASLDYPQLGITQDGLVITYSDFASTGKRIDTFGVAKSDVYNGTISNSPVFGLASNGTLTPPIVIDPNPRAHLLEWDPGSGAKDWQFQDPQSYFYGAITSVTGISGIGRTSVPPSAPQYLDPTAFPNGCPAPTCNLDTLDGRFQSDPVQYGQEEWAANTVNFQGAAVQWLDLWTEGGSAHTVNQQGLAYGSNTSSDWNPAITAAPDGRAILEWTSNDTTNQAQAGLMWTGRLGSDPPGTMEGNVYPWASQVPLTGNYSSRLNIQRWGDTSSIQMDPSDGTRAWSTNEWIYDTNTWGTAVTEHQVQ